MYALIESAVDHARTVLMVLVLLLISGTLTYINIAKEADPDVDIPVLFTNVILDGISPEDSDRMLVRPIEKALEGIEGVKKVNSVAFEGGATVILEFDAGFDPDTAIRDVRTAVDKVKADIPDAAEDPQVDELNLSLLPQLVIGLGGQVPERTLYTIADKLKDDLESIDGVLEVTINGKRDEMVEVIIDPLVLESYNVSQEDLLRAVARNNELVAAGVLDSGVGRVALKVPGVIESAEELLNLPIKSTEGRIVRMRDIATINRVYKDATSIARVAGQPSVTMEVKKRNGANVIETIDEVKRLVELQQEAWPSALEVSYFSDRSVEIHDMLNDLQNNVISAVLLVVLVVIAALGVRSAMLVAIAIPGSFVIGMLVINLLGLTVNIVVLFSFIMSVGLLVDGAIVVTEYADRQMVAKLPRAVAYKIAAKRMAWPIIASTATTLAAFMPLLFWPGVIGEFMKYLPITLIATLTASLLMALLFVPTLGGVIGKTRLISAKAFTNLTNAETGSLHEITGFTGVYVRFLAWAVKFPGSILLLVVTILFASIIAYGKLGNGTEFFPNVEPTQAIVSVIARGDLAVQERDAILTRVETEILKIEEIKTVYSRTVLNDNDTVATITLEFKDWDKRDRRVDEIMSQIRALEESIPGLRLELQKIDAGPGGDQKPIQLAFTAQNDQLAQESLLRVRDWMEKQGGYTDIEDSLPLPGLEWNVNVDREKAGRYGADISLVGTFVQLVTNGVALSTYRPDDTTEELDIRLRFPPQNRHLSQLQELRVSTINGYVPLGNFASIEASPKVTVLKRLNGQSVYRLKAVPLARQGEEVVNSGQLANARLTELHDSVDQFHIDSQVNLIFEGQDEDQQESQLFLAKAMGVALFIMATILVTQFNSFYQAMLVLTAVLMSIGGVFIGLLVTGEAFGIIMTGIGIISLAGIVVNNNIVLIDTFNTLCRQGMPITEAVLRTGAQRLRPVMLTTITTMLGLLPMVLRMNVDLFGREISYGAPSTQWWSQLATAVSGGLAFATVLTLVLTPCLLVYPSIRRANRQLKVLKSQSKLKIEAPRKPVIGGTLYPGS